MRISKNWVIGLGGLLGAAALAIGLGVGLDRAGKQSGQASSSSPDPKSTPLPTSAPSAASNVTPKTTFYDDSPAGLLPVALSLTSSSFDPSMLAGYDECSDFISELEEMAKYMANVEIDRMVRQHYHNEYFYSMPRGGRGGGDMVMLENDVQVVAMPNTDSKSNSGPGESSYGTNNQVDGVDEADTVKSDGTHVFAAYGDSIVVWEASSGIEVSRTVIPTTDDEGIPLCDKERTENCYGNNYNRWQKMTVASLLMHEDRITAIVQSPYRTRDQDQSAMSGSHATRLFVYDKSIPDDKGPLTLMAQKDIQGYYQSARLIDQYAHVVTSSSINAWYHLYTHLDPMNFVDKSERHLSDFWGYYPVFDLKNMTENAYKNAANAKALELIPSFVQQLASEALGTTDISSVDCTSILRLILYSKHNDMEGEGEISPVSFTTAGALSNFAQVTSFSINATFGNMDGDIGKLTTSSSGVFVPFNSYSNSVYSSRDMMIIAGEAYEEKSDGNWEERTVLFAFSLNGAESKAVSIGVVPGSLLNQFSMDHYSYGDADYLRVATTSWARWNMVGDSWGQTEESSSQVTVLSLPSPDSQVDTPTNMEIIGQVDNLGKGERIYAVRFMGTRAFVVTFRQIDPFYTLDMEDPEYPKVVGELKIPGFSNYLHPIEDGNFVLAVGQDADEEGVINGLQIAIYNVTDFGNPSQLKKFSENKGSYSAAQYDHQAFRYLPETEVLILPVSRYQPRFDGFIVYDVTVGPGKKIEKSFEIPHYEEGMQTCWSHSSLTARSMVFEGDVTTMKGHTVLSHALSTKDPEWTLNLDVNLDVNVDVKRKTDCGYWRN